MILGIDIGGTKTLFAVFDENGQLVETRKFATPPNYPDFIKTFGTELKQLKTQQFEKAVSAVPARLNREQGIAIAFGSLDWVNVPIRKDLEQFLPCELVIENDAKLAGLSEASLLINEFSRVLYLTISTGINSVLIIDGIIDPATRDSETGQFVFVHNGKTMQWEDFASGRAFFNKFGQRLADITDPGTLSYIAQQIAPGIVDLAASYSPDIIVMGGGVGAHLDKFRVYLDNELEKLANPMVPLPPIQQAKRAEEAVIYGCYQLATSGNVAR